VLSVNCQSQEAFGTGDDDEISVGFGAVEVGAADVAGYAVAPIDVLGVNRDFGRFGGSDVDEVRFDSGAVEVGTADAPAAGGVAPIDVLGIDRDTSWAKWPRL
jgi:hypothetical protein